MSEELGKIEKPKADDFKDGRKLFLVPLVFSYSGFPQEYTDLCTRYWKQVDDQINSLENKLGSVKYIFHELISDIDDSTVQSIGSLHSGYDKVIKPRTERGAKVVMTEDKQAVAELMDWSRCLSIGLQTRKATDTIHNFYLETSKRRDDFLVKNLDETLKENEICILFMSEGQHIQFPSDIQVFYVAPPVLDEVKRWLRDYQEKVQQAASQSDMEEGETNE